MKKLTLYRAGSAASVVMGALLLAPAAFAQDSEATPETDAAASVETDATDGIQDLVVTAQLRRETAQRAPVAIDVVSSAAVANANITSLPNLSRLVPAIQIVQAAGATPLYFVRGVGSLAGTSLTDAAVSLNYDGVPLVRQYQGNGQFYDLERVEVLRGPQGTLYGRNATGGVVNIRPAAPELGENGIKGSLTVGNYDTINTEGAINVALGEQAALRFAFMTADHDGYLNDGQQDEKGRSARLQLLVEPQDGFRLKVGLDYHHQGGLGGGYALVDQANFAGNPAGTDRIGAGDRVGFLSPRGQAYFAARGRNRPTDPIAPGFDNQFYGLTIQADIETPIGTLTVIPSYRRAELDYYAVNSFSIDNRENDDQYSLEARLASHEDGPLRWIVGGFVMSDRAEARGNFDNFNGTGNRQHFVATTKSLAAFADATYNVTDALRLIGGIRFTHDKKTAEGLQTDMARTGGFIPLSGRKSWDRVNFRVGAQYDLSSRAMVYATYATGFHAGGFYFAAVNGPDDRNSYDPESIRSYTVGLKSKLLDNRLLFNVEAFRWELKGQQVSVFTLDRTGQILFPTLNAGSATNQGVQIDTQFQATDTTLLGAQVQYLDAKFNELIYTQAIPAQPGLVCATSGTPPALTVNCSGQRPPQAPKWSLNLSGDQTIPFASGAEITLGLRAHYQSETLVGFNYLPDDFQKKVWTGDATITFRPESRRWSVGAFVNNVTDKDVKSNATHNGNVQGFQLRPPRTYGVRLGFDF